MKKLFDHIERVKSKPHHVRKRVAFITALAGAGLIGFVWLGTSLSTGAFAIHGSSFAESVKQGSFQVTGDTASDPNLAGAAAALAPVRSGEPRIEIIPVTSSTSVKGKKEETTIPF